MTAGVTQEQGGEFLNAGQVRLVHHRVVEQQPNGVLTREDRGGAASPLASREPYAVMTGTPLEARWTLSQARQIEAFGRDDAPAAFALASPGIQGMFGTPDRFLDMVRRTYPAVYRPRSVEYGELTREDGRIVQHVELTGQDGQPQLALYEMERDGDAWRIAGCTLVRSLRVGT